jgi:hypothetical protein
VREEFERKPTEIADAPGSHIKLPVFKTKERTEDQKKEYILSLFCLPVNERC